MSVHGEEKYFLGDTFLIFFQVTWQKLVLLCYFSFLNWCEQKGDQLEYCSL